jgi:hypothetical protein
VNQVLSISWLFLGVFSRISLSCARKQRDPVAQTTVANGRFRSGPRSKTLRLVEKFARGLT